MGMDVVQVGLDRLIPVIKKTKIFRLGKYLIYGR